MRSHENLAFVPVSVVNSQQTEFGLVRENGGWRLLSLGLLLLDIPELSKQWADAGSRGSRGRRDCHLAPDGGGGALLPPRIRQIARFARAIGPAPKNEISPDQASLLSAELAAGSAGGYHFRYRILPAETDAEATFELAATPDDYGKTGQSLIFSGWRGKNPWSR